MIRNVSSPRLIVRAALSTFVSIFAMTTAGCWPKPTTQKPSEDPSTPSDTPAESPPQDGDSFAIRNGTSDTATTSVGALLGTQSLSLGTRCSGVIVKDRCVLTAAHCLSNNLGFFFPEAEPFSTSSTKFLPVWRTVQRPTFGGTPPGDLAFLWMSKRYCTADSVPAYVARVAGYPTAIKGLQGVCGEGADASWPSATITDDKVTDSEALFSLVGYGKNEVAANDLVIKRRKGINQFVASYDKAFTFGDGHIEYDGAYSTKGVTPDFHRSCPGDSGGGLFASDSNDLHGIIAGVVAGSDCASYSSTDVTHSAAFFEASTKTWIDKQLAEFCRPIFHVTVTNEPSNSGHVLGVMSDPVTGIVNAPRIVCGAGVPIGSACVVTDFAGKMTLTSGTMPNWRFKQWKGDLCPCAGSTSDTCEFESDAVSYRQETWHVWCAAEREAIY